MASRLALQGEPTRTPVSRGALSSLHACWLSTEAGGHRSRPLFQGYAALGEFVHRELGRQTHHNTPPWTTPGASSPRGPHQPWMRPLLAAPPGLPDPPTPVLTLPCFLNRVCHAPPPPSAGSPHPAPNPPADQSHPTAHPRAPVRPPPRQGELWTHCPTCASRAGHRGHLPTPRGDAFQQTQAGWPCPDPAYTAPARPSPGQSSQQRAAAVALPAQGRSLRGVRMGTAWQRGALASRSEGLGSLSQPPHTQQRRGLSTVSPTPFPSSLRPQCQPIKIWEATSDLPQTL